MKTKYVNVKFRERNIAVLVDRVLFFRYLQHLHGRFWGIVGIAGLWFGFSLCFAIRPELRSWSAAFSDFGDSIRTAPYFAGSIFFAAYGLWRWRNYLSRTLKRSRPLMLLLTLTILSLYTIALMPLGWKPWPYRIHIVAVALLGISIALTVVLDGLFSKTRTSKRAHLWKLLRGISFWLIIIGGTITYGSLDQVKWFSLTGLGELLMLIGYAFWIVVKTYRGDGTQTTLSKILHDFVTIN